MSRLVRESDINSFKHYYYYYAYVIHSRFTKYNGVFIKWHSITLLPAPTEMGNQFFANANYTVGG